MQVMDFESCLLPNSCHRGLVKPAVSPGNTVRLKTRSGVSGERESRRRVHFLFVTFSYVKNKAGYCNIVSLYEEVV